MGDWKGSHSIVDDGDTKRKETTIRDFCSGLTGFLILVVGEWIAVDGRRPSAVQPGRDAQSTVI